MHSTSFIALLRHQLRLLAQNRSACLVLLMFATLAAFTMRIQPPADPVCYILYWQDDAWIQRLKAELPAADPSLAIEIAPVERFVGAGGVIEYPRGAHSIQLRPPADERDDWVVWFWYSGSRAEVLDPVTDWFWSVTQRHFGQRAPMHVRVSSLRPQSALLELAGPAASSLVDQATWKGPIVWAAIFFCACYLPAMALVQQREHGNIHSLITTPVGWSGVAMSTSVFYAAVSMVFSLSLAIALGYPPSAGLASSVLLATAVYVALGFALGSWCQSAAAASAGLLVYLTLAGGLALLLRSALGCGGWGTSVEMQLIQSLQQSSAGIIASLAAWALLWFWIARLSFIRLRMV